MTSKRIEYTDNPKFDFVPEGGLGNRMRGIASAYTFSQKYGHRLRCYWFVDKFLMNARFDDLFEPQPFIKEANFLNNFTVDRKRRKNLWTPALFQKVMYDRIVYSAEMDEFYRGEKDIKQLGETKRLYITSYRDFMPYDNKLLSQLFVPTENIKEQIDQRCANFSSNTIGVQIRRTDHIQAIRLSPTELFTKAIDNEIEQNADVKVYLATDSEDIKNELRTRYGNRIIIPSTHASRNSSLGIADGLIEMYALSRTQRIYGSFNSSFSQVAAQIGNIPLIVIKKQ